MSASHRLRTDSRLLKGAKPTRAGMISTIMAWYNGRPSQSTHLTCPFAAPAATGACPSALLACGCAARARSTDGMHQATSAWSATHISHPNSHLRTHQNTPNRPPISTQESAADAAAVRMRWRWRRRWRTSSGLQLHHGCGRFSGEDAWQEPTQMCKTGACQWADLCQSPWRRSMTK